MTKERIEELRELCEDKSIDPRGKRLLISDVLPETLDEIERLKKELDFRKNAEIPVYKEENTRFREALINLIDSVEELLLLNEPLDDNWTLLRDAVKTALKAMEEENG